jgi:predicted nicotinamide N-methyase
MKAMDPVAFIRANLCVAPVPSVPEIRLYKAGTASGLRRLGERDEQGFGSPYWAYYWAGGLALARYVLGAGSGLVSIASAKAGARTVIAAEVDRYAMVALELNAEMNGVAVSAALGDPTAGEPPGVDVILVGDLFYERDLAERVTAFLDRCLAAGIEILIGDPWRAYLPVSRLRVLAEYRVAETGSTAAKPSGVFHFLAENALEPRI